MISCKLIVAEITEIFLLSESVRVARTAGCHFISMTAYIRQVKHGLRSGTSVTVDSLKMRKQD